MTGYEDVGVSDTDYYSAYKNGKLYLVSKDGKNTSEIGEGAYCYIYSYDEYKELNLLKIDVFLIEVYGRIPICLTIMEI